MMNKKIITATTISVLMGAALGYHGVMWYGDDASQDKKNEGNTVKKGRVNAPHGVSASSNKSEKKLSLHEILKESDYYRKKCELNTYYASIRSEQREAEFQKILELDGEQRSEVLESFFNSWARQEPRSALAAAERIPRYVDRKLTHYYVFDAWAEKNPEDAADYFLVNKERMGEICMFMMYSDDYVRIGATCSIVKHLANISPEKALAWIAHVEDEDTRETLQTFLISRLAKKDPFALLENRAQFFPREELTTCVAITKQWVKQDLAAAQQWIETLPKKEKKRGLDAILETLSEENPQKALDWAQKNLSIPAQPSNAFSAILSALNNVKTSEAKHWIQSFPDSPEKTNIMETYAVGGWPDRNYTERTEFILTIPDKHSRKIALSNALYQWMLDDDVAAKKWFETAPLDKEAREYIANEIY